MPRTSFSSKMPRMDAGGERIGVNGAAALLDVAPEKVRRFVQEGRLRAERGADGDLGLILGEVLNLARGLEAEAAEEEIFDGEVMGDDPPPTNSRLPAVPFERHERLLPQGPDAQNPRGARRRRLQERRAAPTPGRRGTRQAGEGRGERDAARMEIDRLWSEIERLNLVEFQRELQEKTISTLEEEKQRLEEDRSRLVEQHTKLTEEKSALSEDRVRLEAELNALKNRGFWSRLFGG